MFDGMQRRVASLWFPKLASDRILRQYPVSGPFVLTIKENNANRIYCLNTEAMSCGLHRGMSYADARAFCPDLQSIPADPVKDHHFLHILCRWATRYCPWVGLEGDDGLVLNITGSCHLWGGEEEMVNDIRDRMMRAGISVQIGLGDTRGSAWALAHYREGIASAGNMAEALQDLPVAALRLTEETSIALQRLGMRKIGSLTNAARAPLTRRFGPDLILRLDQAIGKQNEDISPINSPPHYGMRLTLPEPIGLLNDVMAGTERLLEQLCAKLKAQDMGARTLCMTLRRVDQEHQEVELRLARAMHDPKRILTLFERGLSKVEAGFGIDQLRLNATQVEALPPKQIINPSNRSKEKLDDLISRIGARIGLDNIQRFLPADSHIPERSFVIAPVAYSKAENGWSNYHPRPISLFPVEPIAAIGSAPPKRFRWRRMFLTLGRATGPERIAPEWWFEDENWRSGLRDYWRIETREGRRLWMFHTPQNPGWFVQGEFA